MSKVVLVLDKMPENCLSCLALGHPDISCEATGIPEKLIDDPYERPDWCPLKELPERMAPLNEEDVKGIKETFTNYHAGHVVGWNEGFRDGWNYCLKKILG